MDSDYLFDNDGENMLAAWLDGTLPPEEDAAYTEYAGSDPQMQEMLDASDDIGDSYDDMLENGYEMPAELDGDFDIPEVPDAGDDFGDIGYQHSSDAAHDYQHEPDYGQPSGGYHEVEDYEQPADDEYPADDSQDAGEDSDNSEPYDDFDFV